MAGMTAGETIKDGNDAARLLDSPAFKRAMQSTAAAYIAKIKASGPKDDVERRVWGEMLNALDTLDANLKALMAAGKIAESRVEVYEPQPEQTRFARMFRRAA